MKKTKSGGDTSPRRDFMLAALGMSWQLALVILLPILGGFQLDKSTDNAPVFTVVGFFIAMAGMAVVMWRVLQRFSPPSNGSSSE